MSAEQIDLRDFPFMPLYIERLRRSKAWLECKKNPELAFYLLNLWTRSWHEVPAGSMEDNDDVLADAAMCPVSRWLKIRDKVLRNWEKKEDGRWHHPTVTELAAESWQAKIKQRNRTAAARAAKLSQRTTENATYDVTGNVTKSVTDNATGSKGREGKGIEIESLTSGNSEPGPRDLAKPTDARVLEIKKRVVEAFENANSPNPPDTSMVDLWAAQGLDLAICLAVVAAGIKRRPSISSLKYFTKQIQEAHEKRVEPRINGGGATETPEAREQRWRQEWDYWKKYGRWIFGGPNPDCAGCHIPKEKIAEWTAQ